MKACGYVAGCECPIRIMIDCILALQIIEMMAVAVYVLYGGK